jgi:hypothetical protein
LFRDRLLVSLAPGAVSWVRLTRGVRPRVSAKRALAVDPEYGAEPWSGAVAALAPEAEQWRRERLAVTVVLSNHFVRYTVVPPAARSTSAKEALALARFHFSKVHGERAAAWDVRLSPASAGASLASAIDIALLEAIKACFQPRGKARLVSIQPYTMAAFNFWRGRIDRHGAWLLLVEPGTACVAMLAGKGWASVQNVKSAYAAPDKWPALLDREKHRISVEDMPRTVLTRCEARVSSALAARKDWHFVMLDPPAVPGVAAEELESYAMALHAA